MLASSRGVLYHMRDIGSKFFIQFLISCTKTLPNSSLITDDGKRNLGYRPQLILTERIFS